MDTYSIVVEHELENWYWSGEVEAESINEAVEQVCSEIWICEMEASLETESGTLGMLFNMIVDLPDSMVHKNRTPIGSGPTPQWCINGIPCSVIRESWGVFVLQHPDIITD